MGGDALGMWGPVTATLDWCEANYQFSNYIAEWANTLSNTITISFAIFGAQSIIRQRLPPRYLTSFAGLALVGLGSFAFHATLLYEAQMADELPMIYTASWVLFVLLEVEPGFEYLLPYGWSLLFGTLLFNILFTWSYYMYRNPIYHQVVFALLLLGTVARTLYLTHFSPNARDIPEAKVAKASELYTTGAILFVFGFLIWNLDNVFCNYVTNWKHVIGWPAAFLLEGHAWWHVFTGAGSYYMLEGNTYLSLCIKDNPDKYSVYYFAGFPVISYAGKEKSH